MDIGYAQRQIDSLQETLKKAKESAVLAPNDPGILELERIMLRTAGELEAAKAEARNEDSCAHLFFPDDELVDQASTTSGARRFR